MSIYTVNRFLMKSIKYLPTLFHPASQLPLMNFPAQERIHVTHIYLMSFCGFSSCPSRTYFPCSLSPSLHSKALSIHHSKLYRIHNINQAMLCTFKFHVCWDGWHLDYYLAMSLLVFISVKTNACESLSWFDWSSCSIYQSMYVKVNWVQWMYLIYHH